MPTRLPYPRLSPDPFKALMSVEAAIRASGLEHKLIHLIKLRASQINGCAYCIDMHWKDARAADEPEHRLYALDAWHESPFYTDRERAALAWTDALTNIAATHAPDDVFEALKPVFSEKEIVDLTWAIAAINAWNRMAIAFRAEPGHYRPAPEKH
jgi:AhpD family alkylhydroperoxidase